MTEEQLIKEADPLLLVKFEEHCSDMTDPSFIEYLNENYIAIVSAQADPMGHNVVFKCYQDRALKFLFHFWPDYYNDFVFNATSLTEFILAVEHDMVPGSCFMRPAKVQFSEPVTIDAVSLFSM